MKDYWKSEMMKAVLTGALSLIVVATLHSAEPDVDPKELPRIPAVEASQALGTFKVKPGFHLELAAAEPVVADPTAPHFDEAGRLFVVEMRGYSERRDDAMGRIRRLVDADGDGRYESSTVFEEGLRWPTAVICYGGGVFVGATPDVWFLKDTDGDGVADEKKVVFTGFGLGRDRLNVQALFNSFRWGLDNRIHGATAGNGGTITRPDDPNFKPVKLNGRDFSFDPRTLELRAEGSTAQHGMTFDNWGQKYICSNSSHIQALMYDPRYADQNPDYPMPDARVSVAADGPAAEVFRLSPDEPWRIVRTRWRVTGAVKGIVEGGGRVSGYFTAATGVTIYRGDALGDDFVGNAFIGDAGSNLIHRKKIRYEGVLPVAERPADEQKVEFVASTDNWFRPVQFANAPDGSLYVADMYRETIEHPWSIPESIKQYLDLNSGNDRGRIYRIAPDGWKRRGMSDLGAMSSVELAGLLAHPNGWHRDTAARLLFERQDPSAVSSLQVMVEKSGSPYGRLHALYVLDGMNKLDLGLLMAALRDKEPRVRQHGLILLEHYIARHPPGSATPMIWAVAALMKDPDPFVSYQLALFHGAVSFPGKVTALTQIALRSGGDPWIRAAILSALKDGAGDLFERLAGNEKADPTLMVELAEMIGRRNHPDEIKPVVKRIGEISEEQAFTLAASLGEGLRRAKSSLLAVDGGGVLAGLLAKTSAVATDDGYEESRRRAATRLLGLADFATAAGPLSKLLTAGVWEDLQADAVDALAGFSDPAVPGLILSRWDGLASNSRSEALRLLLARADRASQVLESVQAGKLRVSDLSAAQVQYLRGHKDAQVKALAARVLGSPPAQDRQAVVDAYLPALRESGDAAKGIEVYRKLCVSCHKFGAEGHALGPDLVTMKSMGKERIMVNILDPNREVAPQYFASEIETKDGESAQGILVGETDAGVTLRQAFGVEQQISRANIAGIRNSGMSIMPVGLEAGMSPAEMADLLAFIVTAEVK